MPTNKRTIPQTCYITLANSYTSTEDIQRHGSGNFDEMIASCLHHLEVEHGVPFRAVSVTITLVNTTLFYTVVGTPILELLTLTNDGKTWSIVY